MPKVSPHSTTLTLAQAAALIGKSPRWVQILVQQGWIQRDRAGEYPLVALVRGVLDYQQDLLDRREKLAREVRAGNARTREIEIRTAQRMAGLISARDTIEVVDGMARLATAEFSTLPERFCPDPAPREALRAEVNRSFARIEEVAQRARLALGTGRAFPDAAEEEE